jgi:hypothetical protein
MESQQSSISAFIQFSLPNLHKTIQRDRYNRKKHTVHFLLLHINTNFLPLKKHVHTMYGKPVHAHIVHNHIVHNHVMHAYIMRAHTVPAHAVHCIFYVSINNDVPVLTVTVGPKLF